MDETAEEQLRRAPSDPGGVEELSLWDISELPDELGALTNLKDLTLRGEIPDRPPNSLWTLPSLENLELTTVGPGGIEVSTTVGRLSAFLKRLRPEG